MTTLRYRQVHLDFHTSEAIPGIGEEFDPDEFGDVLAQARVNSVTCFSRCHHGWLYHPSARFPERVHPHLKRNLLGEQIEACHARGIRVPIYITVRWDHFTARERPEWLVQDENGSIVGSKPFEPGFYRQLCLNTPFVDFLEEQTVEVCENFPVDGIFYDIVFATPCSCPACVKGMLKDGLNPSDAEHRALFADKVLLAFQDRLFKVVKSHHPEATVFFNSGHIGPKHRRMIDSFTHFELESLPSGGWGYMHFPVTQRFARTLGRDTMGMTGKFHTSWGDFGSFKNPAALDFECLRALALGSKCGVGDQLPPSGRICKETYKLIGSTYAKVEAAEPWCAGAVPQSDIGVFAPEAFSGGGGAHSLSGSAIGVTRILQESRHQFDFLDAYSDLSKYSLLVLPDCIQLDEPLAKRIDEYVDAGGSLLATYRSGLNLEASAFALECLGLKYVGEAPFCPDYIVPGKLEAGLRPAPHVMYQKGIQVEALAGTESLSPMVKPYFNRTWEHFCSHAHTPAEGPVDYPGATQNGRCIYLMHPVFSIYSEKAPLWCKKLVTNSLDILLAEPLILAGGPSSALFTLNLQPKENRLVLHALHYVPERRGQAFDVIEDVIPVFDVPVSVRVDSVVNKVALQPQGQDIQFTQSGGRVVFVIPKIDGHQMVEIGLG